MFSLISFFLNGLLAVVLLNMFLVFSGIVIKCTFTMEWPLPHKILTLNFYSQCEGISRWGSLGGN